MNSRKKYRKVALLKNSIKKFSKFPLFVLLLTLGFYNTQNEQNTLNWDNVKKDFEYLADKYEHLSNREKNIDEDSPIWMMWYQGLEEAPPIVLSCFQSVIENRAKHPVYILSKYNLDKYIHLPNYIIKKFNKGIFTITHFSDIVRMALLYKYGGYWIDSTYLITKPLADIKTSFYTLKLNYCWTFGHPFIKCAWSVNFMGYSKKSFIATYGYKALLLYWKKYNSQIDYFLIDYLVYIAYNRVQKFNNTIDKLPYVNCSIFSLVQSLGFIYHESYFECPFHKLTKNENWISVENEKKTNFGYILEKYKFKLDSKAKYIIVK